MALGLTACDVNTGGDDWTPAKRITLGNVSILVPESYTTSSSSSSQLEVDNGFDGGSVLLHKEAVGTKTQDQWFTDKISNFNSAYGVQATSDTTLLGNTTKRIEGAFMITTTIGHPIIDFVFLYNNYVYTVEFSWTQEKDTKSRRLMYDMLETLEIK